MSRAQGDVPHQTTDAPHPTETGEETCYVVDLRKPEFRDQPTSEQGDGPHTGERGDGRAVDEQPLGEQAEGALKNNLHSIISYADFILRRLAVDHPMRQDRPMISHLETAREQATWLIERFTYVPGSVSRSEIHEHMQQIQSASRIILPEIAYGKQPAQLETWKGIHLCRLEILQVLQHHDPKDRPPHEVSELRQPPEDAPRTLIEKHLSYMQEQLPGLQRDIHWITPDYSTSTPQQMHRHMARCQESVGRLSTMLEGG
ncbi:MAG: hypothetical protein J2P36_19345, partial [Ktedonobacteraceae bacterium]|nr:hypothetical protein [Ktedonobacteraceae bacterium]